MPMLLTMAGLLADNPAPLSQFEYRKCNASFNLTINSIVTKHTTLTAVANKS